MNPRTIIHLTAAAALFIAGIIPPFQTSTFRQHGLGGGLRDIPISEIAFTKPPRIHREYRPLWDTPPGATIDTGLLLAQTLIILALAAAAHTLVPLIAKADPQEDTP